ncbi:MAG: phage holin family protein [Abitibacteriaceae bacterium]|nr:phage holin family protein [Abditibacteriaceae bacterium]MBV9865263.1 phage holin family protein [Abditibacteriaceae bacterium]
MLQQNQQERSVGELFADLSREVSNLVRQEVQLAKTELTEKATQTGKNLVSIVIGGVLAFAGLLGLEAAAILGLARVLPDWGAALLVAVVILIVAMMLVMKGINALKNQDLVPRQTVDTLKEDAQWAKQQVK